MTSKTIYEKDSTGNYILDSFYEYYWSGEKLIGYKLVGNNGTTVYLQCLYDENDEAIGFIISSASISEPSYAFYFVKNVQGDIVEIVDENCAEVVGYTYDAWGNVSCHAPGTDLSQIVYAAFVSGFNPFCYRGYLYDKDTGYYYLQSRFYNPQWGRFLNADEYTDTTDFDITTYTDILGTNMFAYCNNDPINSTDKSGNWGYEIHYGSIQNKEGTIYWAIDCGFCTHYATQIAAGDQFIDDEYPAWKALTRYQKYHFNRDIAMPGISEDSREYCATLFMNSALAYIDQQNYKKAMFEFGKALHCIQDTDAHGQCGAKNPGIAVQCKHADDPNYDWKDNSQTSCVWSADRKRYNSTKNTTIFLMGMILFYIGSGDTCKCSKCS